MSDEPDTPSSYTTQNPEYPSLAYIDPDSSSDIKGILRARNSRAPPNTPYPTVRFVDPWLTSIRNKSKQPKADVDVSTEDDSLPAAQISGEPRWKRLGAILGAIDRGLPEDPDSFIDTDISHDVGNDPLDISATDTAITTSFSSDSPICFARFDTANMISSTPLRKPRTLHSLASPFLTPPKRAPRDRTHSSSSLSPSSSCLLSPGPNEEEATVENCSALEGLWEYGSSDGSEAAGPISADEEQQHTSKDLDGDVPSRPISPHTPQNPPLAHSPVVNMGSSGLGVRRGSGELLPLKYTGRVAHKIEDGKLLLQFVQRKSADDHRPIPVCDDPEIPGLGTRVLKYSSPPTCTLWL